MWSNDITKTIARSLGITEERAEMMKISGKNFFSLETGLNFPSLDLIISEIARILSALPKNGNEPNIDALILSGGTAGLFGLEDFIQKKLGVKTIVGNPFGRVGYDKKIEPAIEKIKNQFSHISLPLFFFFWKRGN
mgnify:CR=1 FL=1